jgi:hypothetical protein
MDTQRKPHLFALAPLDAVQEDAAEAAGFRHASLLVRGSGST